MPVLVRSHVSKPSSLPRTHGAEARGAKRGKEYSLVLSHRVQRTLKPPL